MQDVVIDTMTIAANGTETDDDENDRFIKRRKRANAAAYDKLGPVVDAIPTTDVRAVWALEQGSAEAAHEAHSLALPLPRDFGLATGHRTKSTRSVDEVEHGTSAHGPPSRFITGHGSPATMTAKLAPEVQTTAVHPNP